MVINIDSSEQSRARLQLQPTPRCAGFALLDLWVGGPASPDLWVGGSILSDPEATGSVSPDGDPYRRQPLQVQAYGPGSKL